MTDSRADEVIRDQERMASDRANFEALWEQVAQRVLPRLDDFRSTRTPGVRRDEHQFDSTAPLALETFAAAVESVLCPRNQKWHSLRVSDDDDDLNERPDVRRYLDAVRDQLFRVRYAPEANFAGQVSELFMSLGAFGTGGLFIEDVVGRGIRYQAIHLAELYVAESAAGLIDKVHRRYKYTARQAMQKFGEALPDEIKTKAQKEPESEFEFIHCVKPNSERQYGKRGPRGMPFASYTVSCTGRKLLAEGGYRTMPYSVSRYVTSPREVYGRSPAVLALANIKMLNEAMKAMIKQAQMAVDPPLLMPDDDVIRSFQLRPGALNYGGVDANGNPLVHPLKSGSEFNVAFEVMEQMRSTINRSFLVTLFQILVDAPQMTATEALLRAQEKGALLAPAMGRQQTELLEPTIARELDILAHAGALPPMPDALRQAGGEIRIAYETPLTRAQRAEEGVALARTLEGIAPLATVDPSLLKRINGDEAIKMLAEVNGLPNKILRSDDEMAEMAQNEQAQQAMAALAEGAPIAAQTAKDFALAGKATAEARAA